MGVVEVFIISAIISSIGLFIQQNEARIAGRKRAALAGESAAAVRRGEEAQQKAADLQAVRRRQQIVREGRIRRARAIQRGVSAGVGTQTTSVQGAAGAVTSDVASTLSFLDQTRALNTLARTEFGRAREISSRTVRMGGVGSTLMAVGNIGMQASGSKYGSQIFGG